MRHDSFIYAPWLTCAKTRVCMCNVNLPCPVLRRMTRSYICHESFICVTWLIHSCAMTRSSAPWLFHTLCICSSALFGPVTHVSFTCVPWLIDICAMTHSYMHYESVSWVMTRSYMCNNTYISDKFTYVQISDPSSIWGTLLRQNSIMCVVTHSHMPW